MTAAHLDQANLVSDRALREMGLEPVRGPQALPSPADAQVDPAPGAPRPTLEAGSHDDQRASPHPKRRRIQEQSQAAQASSSASYAAGAWIAGSEWGRGHDVRLNGSVAFCVRCGAYAIHRVGCAISTECSGPAADTKLKVERMRAGRHPVTGAPLAAAASNEA